MDEELKPCPHCGSTDVGGSLGLVHCYGCKVSMHSLRAPDSTAAAIAAWNRRAESRVAQDAARWMEMDVAPNEGTMCLVILRYTLDQPAFIGLDKWDVQREDPLGMGGPTIETGVGWNDNDCNDVLYWMPMPSMPETINDPRECVDDDADRVQHEKQSGEREET